MVSEITRFLNKPHTRLHMKQKLSVIISNSSTSCILGRSLEKSRVKKALLNLTGTVSAKL